MYGRRCATLWIQYFLPQIILIKIIALYSLLLFSNKTRIVTLTQYWQTQLSSIFVYVERVPPISLPVHNNEDSQSGVTQKWDYWVSKKKIQSTLRLEPCMEVAQIWLKQIEIHAISLVRTVMNQKKLYLCHKSAKEKRSKLGHLPRQREHNLNVQSIKFYFLSSVMYHHKARHCSSHRP